MIAEHHNLNGSHSLKIFNTLGTQDFASEKEERGWKDDRSQKRCVVCGCIMPDGSDGNICDCCKDELDQNNPYNAWMQDYKEGGEEE